MTGAEPVRPTVEETQEEKHHMDTEAQQKQDTKKQWRYNAIANTRT